MVTRLFLGCGAVGQQLLEATEGWTGKTRAVCTSESRVKTLREEGVDATVGDPSERESLAAFEDVGVVVVASDDADKNQRVAAVARRCFPDAFLLAYAGHDADTAAIRSVADRVVDPTAVVATAAASHVSGEAAEDSLRLQQVITEIDGTLAVVMHDNPDPDAIASGVAMCRLAEATGTDAEACYYGEISHQENRAMVNLLDLDLRTLGPEDDLAQFGGFALVDHARPSVNNQLPEELHVDVVVDHHPPRGPVQGRYQDIRTDVGSTSTLLTDHCHRLGVRLDESVATALLYGIQIDTNEFRREASRLDFEAAARLLPYVDEAVLDRIESPSVDGETLDTLSRAIENREVRGSVIVTGVGSVSDRDALPQAADKLLTMSGITCTLVYGFIDDTTYVSARARGTDVDLGETLRAAFDQIGSAGGHADMAGAQIPVTQAFGEFAGEEERDEAIRDVLTDRFFDAWYERPRDSDIVKAPRGSSGLPYDRE
ncbi:DHH family phosphoesterase [Haloarchaeobius iranensis]|uniref:NanoRNase/pAp phosphatase, hydrolyzes c-di-AMP and oligoRNAs n=1 Tax=Haloarchaeobius iranensis TaxID=996166 RepID=A0A1G9WJ65_9EURY|nr:DHH family phosphoesterase [Haloarchaeobius iranensis]SDM84584.1 nanoRNase/pAp phosphatase, hydrolyzes c-di-AMP and oligoRNAs [Haloarchaeobius iranensis]